MLLPPSTGYARDIRVIRVSEERKSSESNKLESESKENDSCSRRNPSIVGIAKNRNFRKLRFAVNRKPRKTATSLRMELRCEFNTKCRFEHKRSVGVEGPSTCSQKFVELSLRVGILPTF